MFITKKKFEMAIREAQEEACKKIELERWRCDENRRTSEALNDLDRRLRKLENPDGEKPVCPCAVTPNRY